MSQNSRWLWPAAILALGAALWYRSSALETPQSIATRSARILLVTGGPGPYWDAAVDGAKAAAKKYAVELQVKEPTEAENLAQQVELLTQEDFSQFDGIGLSPIDAEGQSSLINRIAEATSVITFDSDSPQSNRLAYVGTSNFGAGRLAARLAMEALPQGGKVAVLLANLTRDNMQDRRGGFYEFTRTAPEDKPKLEIVSYAEDHGKQDECAAAVKKTLEAHPDLAALIAMSGPQGPTVLKTLRELDKLGQVKLITFDDEPETLAGVEEGTVYATVVQNPYQYGFETVRMLAELCRGDELARPISSSVFSVAPVTVTKANLEKYRASLESRK